MPRKRKVAIAPASVSVAPKLPAIPERPVKLTPMIQIFEKVQLSESVHGKYIKEMQQIYNKVSIVSSICRV